MARAGSSPALWGCFTANLSFLMCWPGRLSLPARNRHRFAGGASWSGESTPQTPGTRGREVRCPAPCPRWELEEEHGRNAAGSAGPGLGATSVLGLCAPSCSLPVPSCVLQAPARRGKMDEASTSSSPRYFGAIHHPDPCQAALGGSLGSVLCFDQEQQLSLELPLITLWESLMSLNGSSVGI